MKILNQIIFFTLLIFVLSKNKIIEYNKKTAFSKNNKEFEFTFNGEDGSFLFIYIDYTGPNTIYFKAISSNNTTDLDLSLSHGYSSFFPLKKDLSYTLIFENLDSTSRGTIWINPSDNEISVDLDKKYEQKYPMVENSYVTKKLIYTIDNASRDATFVFTYEDLVHNDLILPNPFSICHNNECNNNTLVYEFKKGESYKIYIRMFLIEDYPRMTALLPEYSFHDKDYQEDTSYEVITDDPEEDTSDNKQTSEISDDTTDNGNIMTFKKLNYLAILLVLMLL